MAPGKELAVNEDQVIRRELGILPTRTTPVAAPRVKGQCNEINNFFEGLNIKSVPVLYIFRKILVNLNSSIEKPTVFEK